MSSLLMDHRSFDSCSWVTSTFNMSGTHGWQRRTVLNLPLLHLFVFVSFQRFSLLHNTLEHNVYI